MKLLLKYNNIYIEPIKILTQPLCDSYNETKNYCTIHYSKPLIKPFQILSMLKNMTSPFSLLDNGAERHFAPFFPFIRSNDN